MMTKRVNGKLFSSVNIGPIALSHRVVMAPLTRSRSEQPGDIPGSLMLEYYTQRASEGGLIISEATTIAISGRGWFGAPGMYPDEQVAGWKKITGVRKEGNHYRWVPVEYMNDALKQQPQQNEGGSNMQTNEKQEATSLLKSLQTGDPKPLDYINPNKYIQHNLNVATGLQGLKELFSRLPPDTKVNTVRAFQDAPFVFVHTEYDFFGPKVGFDIFRFEDGRIVEHWDNLQETPKQPNLSGHTMTDGPTAATDVEKTDANKQLVRHFVEDIFVNVDLDKFSNYFDGDKYVQHNPRRSDGAAALGDKLREAAKQGTPLKCDKIHRVLGEGNFVLTVSEGQFAGKHTSFYDLWRVENGKIAEHWDTVEAIPEKAEWKNSNGKF